MIILQVTAPLRDGKGAKLGVLKNKGWRDTALNVPFCDWPNSVIGHGYCKSYSDVPLFCHFVRIPCLCSSTSVPFCRTYFVNLLIYLNSVAWWVYPISASGWKYLEFVCFGVPCLCGISGIPQLCQFRFCHVPHICMWIAVYLDCVPELVYPDSVLISIPRIDHVFIVVVQLIVFIALYISNNIQ